MRKKFAAGFLVFLLGILFCGLFYLEAVHGRRFRYLSDKNCIRLLPQAGARGRILDRHGSVVVDNQLNYDVMVLPPEANQLDKILAAIARILGTGPQNLKSAYRNNYRSPFMPVMLAKNIEIRKIIALEELKMDFPGIVIQPHPERKYPFGKIACHIIGYLNEIDHWRLTKLADYGYNTRDIVGYTGVEEKYDYYLRQEEGATSVEVDHRGRFVRILGFKPAVNGRDIQLTLDLAIQKIIEESLGNRRGSIIVLDPLSGQVLAMASSPNYNPELFIQKNEADLSRIFRDPDSPLMNRAFNNAYPPGSVFKLVVAALGLESKKINLGTTFFCPGGMNVGRRYFKCWDTHQVQDLLGAIARSCDVFFYHTGLLAGPAAIHDYAVKFGFARPTGIDLPYEESGFVPEPLWKKISRLQNWYDGDTANFAIGQGDLLVTPLQVVRMTAVFANNGYLVTPYIVKAIGDQDIATYQQKIKPLGLKKKTVESVREGMRKAVTEPGGTAGALSGLGIAVAGKTGSAQVSRGQAHGWFCGFFPYANPRFVICTFLENGGSGHAATVLTKQIIERMLQEKLTH